jgi:hypothetical protein
MKPSTTKKVVIATVIIILGMVGFSEYRNSDYVDVKYRENPVEIQRDSWESIDTSRSSFIREAHYDKEQEYMIIKLNDTNYHYCGLPEYVWESFKNASSLGSYYSSYIRGNYDCRENPVPEY